MQVFDGGTQLRTVENLLLEACMKNANDVYLPKGISSDPSCLSVCMVSPSYWHRDRSSLAQKSIQLFRTAGSQVWGIWG